MNRTKSPADKRPAAPQAPVVADVDPAQLAEVRGGAYEAYVTTKGTKQGSGTGT